MQVFLRPWEAELFEEFEDDGLSVGGRRMVDVVVGRNDDVLSDLVQIVDQKGNWENRGHWRHFKYWFELLIYHKKNFFNFSFFYTCQRRVNDPKERMRKL